MYVTDVLLAIALELTFTVMTVLNYQPLIVYTKVVSRADGKMSFSQFSISESHVAVVVERLLSEDEHSTMCELIQKGFVDSLFKFLDGFLPVSSKERENTILSSKIFNPEGSGNRIAPLVLAALEGRINIVQLFLDVFRDVIDLDYGSYVKYPDQFHFGRKQVVGFSSQGVTALNAACVGGFTDIVIMLIQFGADINKVDYFGYSPLCNAARYGHAQTIECLLKSGANVSHRIIAGYAPIHLAALHGQADVIKVMFSKMIDPLYHHHSSSSFSSKLDVDSPCPMYLAAANGWTIVVDLFAAQPSCPSFCKIDAKLLLGAASRLLMTSITDDSMTNVIKLWIEARKLNDKRDITSCPMIYAYGYRKECVNEDRLQELMQNSGTIETETLYQSLIIHERCMGASNSYNWVFLAGIKMYQQKHYKEAEVLWQRAMKLHYEFATQNVGNKFWQHDLKGSVEYMMQFAGAVENMVNDGYTPMWVEYIEYALQQLKLCILTSFKTNILESSSGILRVYYCLLQIFSCWIVTDCGSYTTSSGFESSCCFPETLERVGQSFVDTAGVLTRTNLLHVAIHPAATLKVGRLNHWQTSQRLPGLLKALITWGCIDNIDEMVNGERPLHLAAKLPNKILRNVTIEVLIHNNAHEDSVNKDGKTPQDVYKSNYPDDMSPFNSQVRKLLCLAACIISKNNVNTHSSITTTQLKSMLELHTSTNNNTEWIKLNHFNN
jgi:ankyrin repeat protein